MDCPKCGYVLDPFQASCPKCARTPASTTDELPIQKVAVMPTPMMPAPPPHRPQQPSPHLQQFVRDEPELGWPLTILLWIVIGCCLLPLLPVLLALVLRGSFSPLAFVVLIVCTLQVIPLFAMLRCQRWGFYLYCIFAVAPAVYSIFFGLGFVLQNIASIAFAIAIFILVLSKWDRFD
jgi:hypothetical protein